MRKLLLLFFALLTGVSGAWAETKTFTVTYAKGSTYGIYYKTDGSASAGSTWDVKWVSGGDYCTQLPNVTISSDQASISSYNARFLNGNYTISVPEGLIITGYTMQAKSYEEGATDTEKYITPAGESAIELNTSTDTKVEVTGLSSNTANFAITGTEGTVSRVMFSSFTINVQAEVLTSLASANSSKRYYLVSRRGFLTTNSTTASLGNLGCVVKNVDYIATPLSIVTEDTNTYLKTFDGKYITSTGSLAAVASGVLSSDASGVTDFPFVLKIGDNYLNSGTGGTYGIIWNTWGANGGSEYDAGNCYAIMEAPSEETLNFSLTDVNGAVYSGTYIGVNGVTIPTFTGCAGYTLSGTSWDLGAKTLSGTINFPFPVSTNSVTNYTYIGNFSANAADFFWFVTSGEATEVYVNKGTVPNASNYTQYDWSIEPTLSGLDFSFTIKNRATGTYITSTSTTAGHGENGNGVVSLSGSGTSLTYILDSSYYRWCLPTTKNNDGTTKLELSVNSANDGKGDQRLGTYTVHPGTSIKFTTRSDFETLISTLTTVCTAFTPYNPLIGDGLGEYSGVTSADMTTAYSTAISSASVTATAAQLGAWIATLENPASKLSINQPTGKFIRFFSSDRDNKYMGVAESGKHPMESDVKDAGIYYVNLIGEENHIVSYKYGQYLRNEAGAPHAAVGNNGEAFTFSQSDVVGKYYVNCGGYLVAWTSTSDRLSSPDKYARWKIEEVDELPVTISSVGFATFCSPVAVTIPSGVKAYTGTISGESLLLSEVLTTIPANTAVVLEGDAGEYSFALTTSEAFDGANDLKGTIAAITWPASGTTYTLQETKDDSGTVGFYTTNVSSIPGFKAYLNTDASVKGFTFDFETAIKALEAAKNPAKMVYDMNGRRVENPTKGLYIVSGKKVVIK